MALTVAGGCVALFALASCATTAGEYCTNNDYASKPAFKAMARSSDNQCYWVWSRNNQTTANADALRNCRAEGAGCTLIRRGNQYVGSYRQPARTNSGATSADFFQGIAAGALMMGGNPAAGAMLMGDLSRRSSTGPAPSYPTSSNLVGIESLGCTQQARSIENETNRISSLSAGWGICQSATESARLYRTAARYHRACQGGNASAREQAAEYDRAASQAELTARSSCMAN